MKRNILSLSFLLSFVLFSSPAFAQTDMTGATVTLTPTGYDYNGSQCRPKVSGIRKGHKSYNSLVEGVDYDLSYTDNVNAGEATATLTFKGNYTGKATKTFTINPKDLSREESVVLVLDVTEVVYEGSEQTPSASDMYYDEKLIVSGTDYDLTYKNNTNPGTATVTATFKGNFTGEKTASFTIKDGGNVPPTSLTVNYYDSSEATPQVERVMTYAEFLALRSSFPNAIAIAPKGFDVWPLDKTNVVMEDEGQNYSCGIFTLTDEKDFFNVAPITVKTLSYSRALAEGYNTCFLPFAVGIADFPEGTKMYRLIAEAEYANVLIFTPIESADAGTPFLVVSPAACTWNISLSDAILKSSATYSSDGNRAFVGTYLLTDEYMYADNNPYFGLSASESKFVPLEETLSPFRACIKVSNSESSQANLGYKIVLSAASPEEAYLTGVEYVDATGTATTTAEDVKVYVLDGSETTLGIWDETTWYVCQTPATENDGKGLAYNGEITLIGDVRIILADGNKMSVTNASGSQCFSGGSVFHIYGQEEGTGILDFSGASNGIYSNCNMTICGGNITASGDDYGIDIYSSGSVTVTGGTVTAIGTNATGIFANGSVSIAGGALTANGQTDGIKASTITLDWSVASDFILASSYNGEVKIPAGRYFATLDGDGNVVKCYPSAATTSDYTLTDEEKSAIAGLTLHPVAMIPSSGEKYIGYSEQDGNMAIVGGSAQSYAVVGYDLGASPAAVYIAPVNGLMKGCGVVLGPASGETYLPDEVGIVIQSGSAATAIEKSFSDASPLRNFIAAPADGTTTLDEQIRQTLGTGTPGQPDYVEADPSDYIIFMIVGGRFRPVNRTAATVLPANTAVLAVSKMDILRSGSAGSKPASARRITLGDGETTGIVSLTSDGNDTDAPWYTLDGRKISTVPTHKGVFIRNGQKVVIK